MKRIFLTLGLIITFSAIGSAQAAFTYYYPHVTTGTYPGGSWRTTIFITNSTNGSNVANGTITFTQSNGSPLNLSFVDELNRPVGSASGNIIGFQLNSGETRKYITVATSGLVSGYATVTANAPVMGTLVFTQYDGAGRMTGEAGVPAAIPLGRQAILVDTMNNFKTGVAIANPNNAPLNIIFELKDTVGQTLQTANRTVPAFQHVAFFISDMFPTAAPMVGRLQFWCTNPMVSVGLRFDPSFALFTTLPPIAIAGLIDLNPPAPLAIIRRYGLLEAI